MPNGSRMISPGCVITSVLPVTLLIRTATSPASMVTHDRKPMITSSIAAAASHSRDGSPPAPLKTANTRFARSLKSDMDCPPPGSLADRHLTATIGAEPDDDGEQILVGGPA